MIKLKDILLEAEDKPIHFTNWVRPSSSDLSREFQVEHEKKGLGVWKSEEAFIADIARAKVTTVTSGMDHSIEGRSHTQSFESLLSLLKSYRSFPKYRNKETLQAIYDGFKQNSPMTMPIVIKDDNGLRIFSGNTRMDVAFQLKISPKVLVVDVSSTT